MRWMGVGVGVVGLLVAAGTRPVAGAGPDNFLCHISHESTPRSTPLGSVHLVDPFETADAVVDRPHHVCNPASINGSTITDPNVQLVTYLFEQVQPHSPVELATKDLFGRVKMTTNFPQLLIVPATDDTGTIDRFKCYRLDYDHFRNPYVWVEDAFTTPPRRIKVRKPRFVCNAVDMNGSGTLDPTRHLICYRHVPKIPAPPDVTVPDVQVDDDFGDHSLDAGKDDLLCVPATIQQLFP